MGFIDIVFFTYMFIGLYVTMIFVLLYFKNRKKLFEFPVGKLHPVSIIIPCFNASKTIKKTLDKLLDQNYPKFEIIVVDDKSSDDSVEIIKKYSKKYKNIRLVQRKKNSGNAATPRNDGIRAAKYDFIAVCDDDSHPEKDALRKMIGFLEDETVGGVTCAHLSRDRSNFLQKMQTVEFTLVAINRKLFDMVDSVYVTPGPFSLYRKKIIEDIGYFDTKNMTEDIEIAWRMMFHGYKVRMSLAAKTYTMFPRKFKAWFRQRIRWSIGGIQTLIKYKSNLLKKGMLGYFVIPFFASGILLSITSVFLIGYLGFQRLFVSILSSKYSAAAGVDVINLNLSLTPSILNLMGPIFFIFILWFGIINLITMREIEIGKWKFNILIHMIFYVMIYPFIILISFYKFLRGKYSW